MSDDDIHITPATHVCPACNAGITVNPMTIEEAREITAAVFAHCVHHLMARPGDKQPPLPDCSLADMLDANRMVTDGPPERVMGDDGKMRTRIPMTVDPRSIAAHYALANWGGPAGLLDALGFQLKRGTRIAKKEV